MKKNYFMHYVFLFFFVGLFINITTNIININKNINENFVKSSYTNQEIKELSNEPNKIQIQDIESGNDYGFLWLKDNHNQEHLYSWGSNQEGQFGNGSVSSIPEPNYDWYEITDKFPALEEGGNVVAIETSNYNNGAVINDSFGKDHFYLWGNNKEGEIGNGETSNYVSTPFDITENYKGELADLYPNGYNINDFGFGENHTGVLLEDKISKQQTIYEWGANDRNQLGYINGGVPQLTPKSVDLPISEDEHIDFITMGYKATAAIVSSNNGEENDKAYVWGYSDDMDYNLGVNVNTPTPTLIKMNSNAYWSEDNNEIGYPKENLNILEWKIGFHNTFAVITDGEHDFVLTVGDEDYLGTSDVTDGWWHDISSSLNLGIEGDERYVDSDVGYLSENENGTTFAVATVDEENDYSLYTWGENDYGQISKRTGQIYDVKKLRITALDNVEIDEVEVGAKNMYLSLIEKENDGNLKQGQNRFISMGDNYCGALGTDEIPTSGNSTEAAGKYIEKSFLPEVENVVIDENTISEEIFQFSVTISNNENGFFNENYINAYSLIKEGTELVKLDIELVNSSENEELETSTFVYEASNLIPNYIYTNLYINIGISDTYDSYFDGEIVTVNNAPIINKVEQQSISKTEIIFTIDIIDNHETFNPTDENTVVTVYDDFNTEYEAEFIGEVNGTKKGGIYEYKISDLNPGKTYTFTKIEIKYDAIDGHVVDRDIGGYTLTTDPSYVILSFSIIIFLIIAILLVAIAIKYLKLKGIRQLEFALDEISDEEEKIELN